MDIIPPQVATRLIFILGIVNLVTLFLIYTTCRCIPGSRISRVTGNLLQYGFYKSIFKYHCYLWWVIWISVIIHAFLALSILR
jgi:hypothetical protein